MEKSLWTEIQTEGIRYVVEKTTLGQIRNITRMHLLLQVSVIQMTSFFLE